MTKILKIKLPPILSNKIRLKEIDLAINKRLKLKEVLNILAKEYDPFFKQLLQNNNTDYGVFLIILNESRIRLPDDYEKEIKGGDTLIFVPPILGG